jgi:hypothetical protein
MRKILVLLNVLIGCTIAFGQGTEKDAKKQKNGFNEGAWMTYIQKNNTFLGAIKNPLK